MSDSDSSAKSPPGDSNGKPCVGLILAGGGARAAYQVGVLKAISELAHNRTENPFPVICGTSAGAINGAVLAIHADRFTLGVRRLNRVWRNFRVHHVFRADPMGIAKSGAHWLAAMMLGGIGRYNPYALFDRTPLEHLLARYIPCEEIQKSVESGSLRAFSVSAAGYSTSQSVTFFQGQPGLAPWRRARRIGIPSMVTQDHLMASSAIPFMFEAIRINREYFGDGSMRQMAPISPALHLGADRVMVIGVRRDKEEKPARVPTVDYPSLAQIAGYVLDSIFLDTLEADLERLQRINRTLSLITPQQRQESQVGLRPVDVLLISPSEDIQQIAARHRKELPRGLRLLLHGVGASQRSGSSLVSYLLFEKGYTRELIDLGYRDTMKRRFDVIDFLSL